MHNLSFGRRDALRVLAASAALPLLATSIGTAGAAGTSSHRYTVGDIAVSVHSDGHFDLPRVAFFDAEGAAPTHVSDTVRIGANTWLIEIGDRLVLVDSGSGTHLHGNYPETGQLTGSNAFDEAIRDRITDVVVTHMHADHIGGLMDGGTRRYPNARLHIMRGEWDFWTAPDTPDRVVEAQKGLAQLIASIADKLDYETVLHEGETEIVPGLRYVPFPGHTPGHAIVHLSSGTNEAMLLGDALLSGDVQFSHPDVRYVLDVDPDLAARARRKLLDRLATDGIPFSATHLDTDRLVRIERSGDGFATVQ